MEKKVRIYTTSGCNYCRQAKEYFTERGIEFETFDVGEDKEALKEMKTVSGGARSVPVIVVCDRVIVGFEPAEIEKALECLQ